VAETFSFELDHVPELLDIVAACPQQYPFLLDSAAPGPLGRYSLLLRTGTEFLCLSADGSIEGPEETGTFLERLKLWQQRESFSNQHNSPWPFCGGWFLFLAYELAAEIEPILDLPVARGGLPVALAVRCQGAVIVEHGDGEKAHIVAENDDLLQQMKKELSQIPNRPAQTISKINSLVPDPNEDFTGAVNKIHRYLEEGDVFQVNLSRAWSGTFDEPVNAIELYSRLRLANPAPFAGLMQWRDSTLLSSSPERLVELHEREVQTRPIAGTYPRGHDADSDLALAKDMLAHPKERAEHIMLIDLERNDLGRVCETGSVEVSELMVLESYAHVHHIVSNVKGKLRDNVGPADVIRAVFPGGTITGCPKVRCMEIIAELEQTGRGFYTGSMGYISLDGQMDLNILIRSMLVEGNGVSLRTGAGIVADSVPERELAETVSKAKGVLKALEQNND
jgi:anthranilate synthase component 1